MVLIDTSVWVRALAGREPFASGTAKLIRGEEAASHELVYGEVLMGDIGVGDRFLKEYQCLPAARRVPHNEVVALVIARRFHGRGIGWIDAHLLASALAGRLQLWTADTRLAAVAEECAVAYRAT